MLCSVPQGSVLGPLTYTADLADFVGERGALNLQEWTMHEWTMTEEVAGMDIAGVDKYGGSCRGGHCRSRQ